MAVSGNRRSARTRRSRADLQRLFASGHGAGVRPCWSVHDLALDRLAVVERAEPVSLKRRAVHEDVGAAFTLDAPAARGIVEPLTLPVTFIVLPLAGL